MYSRDRAGRDSCDGSRRERRGNRRNRGPNPSESTGLEGRNATNRTRDGYETAPFMLLDAPETTDPDRLADVGDDLPECLPHLVVAHLPADARAVTGVAARITEM